MKKNFWDDGITIHDFEKLSLGILLIGVVSVICIKYLYQNTVNSDMVYLTGILAGAFVARKAFKYALNKDNSSYSINNSISDSNNYYDNNDFTI
jgi:hypothetical protein